MKLPQSLASWAQYLTIFPDETSLTIGKMAQRIAPLFGSLRSNAQNANGEPDGYDGLTRRGLYNRLLLSEMALADEMPDEFLRRAAMSEHLFLQLARVEASSSQISVALFDAGPEQLGEPRIAHLAVLIVLQRRAEIAKAKFKWGVLQDEDFRIFDEVTPSNVMHLLNQRTHKTVNDETIKNWRAKLNEIEQADDVWFGASLGLAKLEAAKGFSHFYAIDLLEPGGRQIEVAVRGASGAEKSISLDLPEQKICTRLLRNPFETVFLKTQVADFALNPQGNLLFNDDGSKLFALLDEKRVGCFNVPNSDNAELGHPKKYQHYTDKIISIGNYRRSIALFTFKNSQMLHVFLVKKGKARVLPGDYVQDAQVKFKPPASDGVLLPSFNLWRADNSDFDVAIIDAENSLFSLSKITEEEKTKLPAMVVGKLNILATNVLAAARFKNNFVFVGTETDRDFPLIVSIGDKIERHDISFSEPPRAAIFGYGAQAAHPTFGLIAIKGEENQWSVLSNEGMLNYSQSPYTRVVGVFQEARFHSSVGLIELEDDERTFSFNTMMQRKAFYMAKSRISSVVLGHRSPLMALHTVDGEIIVYSFTHRTEICRYSGTQL